MEKCKKRAMKSSLLVLFAVCVFICITLSLAQPDSVNAAVSVRPKISCGPDHTLVLKSDGTMYGWGSNLGGQLDSGLQKYFKQPFRISSFTNIVDIAAGGAHSLLLKSDGTVYAWGDNDNGQLGNLSKLTGVIAIDAGDDFSIALKNDGTVWTWGGNYYGQLGDGTTVEQNKNPVQVKDLTGVIAIACGKDHALALKNDGTVWAWGYNSRGQLGNGSVTTTKSSLPLQVVCDVSGETKLKDITSISAGGNNSIAIQNDGTLWTWGDNTYGQSGEHITNVAVAEAVDTNSSSYNKVSCGINFTILLDDDQELSSKGRNNYGQLGIGTNSDTSSETPIPLNGAVDISAGSNNAVALMSDGSIWSWGRNDYGQLGDGTTISKNTPVQIKNLTLGEQSVPATPVGLTAAPENGKVSLSWSASQGASYYSVQRATTADGPYSTITTNLTATTYEDTTVTNGTKYYYKVKAISSSGIQSLASSEVSAVPFAPTSSPTGLTATVGNNRVNLSWGTVSGDVLYSLKRATTVGGPYSTIATNLTTTAYEDTTVTNGTRYYYVVTATSISGGESMPSLEVSAVPIAPPSSPTGLTATVGNNRVNLSWGTVSGDVFYSLKRATTVGGPYSTIATNLTTTAYEDTTVTNGTRYYYVVTATSISGGESMPSLEVSAVPIAPVSPSSPTGLTATVGNNRVNLSWGTVSGDVFYSLKRATTAGGPYSTIATNLTTTAYEDTTVTNGTSYYYVVTATSADGVESAASNEVSATPDLSIPLPPTNLKATAGDRFVILTWDPSPSTPTCKYIIRRSTSPDGPYNEMTGWAGTRLYTTGLANNITYYYMVIAENINGKSEPSNIVTVTPMAPGPAAPTGLAAVAADGKVDLSFNTSQGAAYYSIKRATTAGGPYSTITTNLTTTTYQDTSVTTGTMYYYIVTATSADGVESAASNEVSAIPDLSIPLPPTNLKATAGDRVVILTWDPSPSTPTCKYIIRRSTSPDGPYDEMTGWSGTRLYTTGLANNITYYYMVIAENINGKSEPSNIVTVTPTAPAPVAPTNLVAVAGDGKVDLSFNASQGATYYTITRSTTEGGIGVVIISDLASTSYQDTTVTNGITYYYQVSVTASAGEQSFSSNKVSATPTAFDPTTSPVVTEP